MSDKQLFDDEGKLVAEIVDGDGDQQYIQIHPNGIFPFGLLLDYSLVDGKPHAEIDSSAGGPHDEDGHPNLRIVMNDRTAWEDFDTWPELPYCENPAAPPEIGVRYPHPRPKLLKRMWRLCEAGRLDGVHRHLMIEFVRDGGAAKYKLDVLGFGSKFGGWTDSGEFEENIHVEDVVAATLVDGR